MQWQPRLIRLKIASSYKLAYTQYKVHKVLKANNFHKRHKISRTNTKHWEERNYNMEKLIPIRNNRITSQRKTPKPAYRSTDQTT
jgi:hypothetical protein